MAKNPKKSAKKTAVSQPAAGPRNVVRQMAAGRVIRPAPAAAVAATPLPGGPPPGMVMLDQRLAAGNEAAAAWAAFVGKVTRSVPTDADLIETHRLLAAVDRARNQPADLATFFQSVGDGVLQAQRQLDAASAEYSLSDDTPFRTPTAYRIPKVTAELNFSASSVSSRGFNVFIAKNVDEQSQTQQQKVSFDVVATPAPPDLLATVARRNGAAMTFLQDMLVLDAAEREKALKLLDDPALIKDEPSIKEFKTAKLPLLVLAAGEARLPVIIHVEDAQPPAWDMVYVPRAGAPPVYADATEGVLRPQAVAALLLRLSRLTQDVLVTTP